MLTHAARTWGSMTSQPGRCTLWVGCRCGRELVICKLGMLQLKPGSYAYVGSAFGPGGLAARIGHHSGIVVRPHWHVDHLRAACPLIEVWFTSDPRRQEHAWAKALSAIPDVDVPLPGFGSSDCDCTAHLFRFDQPLRLKSFRNRFGAETSLRSVRATDLTGSGPG